MEEVGLAVAREVVGNDAIDQVEVRSGLTSTDDPTYDFFFRVHPDRLSPTMQGGTLLLGLFRGLRQALDQRGDEHFPMVRLLTPQDWQRRFSPG